MCQGLREQLPTALHQAHFAFLCWSARHPHVSPAPDSSSRTAGYSATVSAMLSSAGRVKIGWWPGRLLQLRLAARHLARYGQLYPPPPPPLSLRTPHHVHR